MKGELGIRKAVPGKALKKKKQGNDYVECLNFDLSRVAELVHHALVGAISSFSYVQKVLMKAEEHCAALSVLTEINSENSPRIFIFQEPAFMDKFFAHHLPATIVIMSVQEAKTMFKRDLINLIGGFKLNPMSCLAINHYSLTGEEPSDVHEITFDTSQRFEERAARVSSWLASSSKNQSSSSGSIEKFRSKEYVTGRMEFKRKQ
ncbi:hypothetical protein NC651_014482 [Populus alba x Populus x berolinensis]|nr:hypothetical protein NC651_014482 [Populus alba x Populus x berolinensis]